MISSFTGFEPFSDFCHLSKKTRVIKKGLLFFRYVKTAQLITLALLCFSVTTGKAQKDTTHKKDDYVRIDTTPQLDIIDIVDKIFKKTRPGDPDTMRIPPWKFLPSLAPAVGYTLEGGALASLSLNISFYTGNQDNTSLSVVNTGLQYSLRNQLVAPIITSIWTPGNKYDLLGDWRYDLYPSYTYGLGGHTSYLQGDLMQYQYVKVYQEVLKHFGSEYFVGFGYNYDYHFDIQDPTPVTDYPLYDGTATHTTSSGLVAHFIYDNRTNMNNPKNSFYASLLYRYNTTLLGSDNNWQYIQAEVRKYFKLSPHKVLAFWTWNEFTFGGKAPYFDLPSNGWDTYSNTGRGYIQGRFRGPDMMYAEGELRFRILNNGLIGGVLFANATTVTGWPQQTFGPIYPGEGVGLRFKFNKYSDVNICVDYAFGEQGSHGVFFNLGEVF